jgi:8-oxo-dGTP diphosphatase
MVTTQDDTEGVGDFDGAKVALFLGDRLIVIRRDDFPHISYPDMWDFPGGGRDPGETPFQTVARETREEVGLILPPAAVIWQYRARRASDGLVIWCFVARLPATAEADVVFGDEGQCWRMADVTDVLHWPDVAGALQDWLALWLSGVAACDAALAGVSH